MASPNDARAAQSVNSYKGAQNYVGYRDGQSIYDRLAISYEATGEVIIQVVLPGEGDESARVHTLSLDELSEVVRGRTPQPQ